MPDEKISLKDVLIQVSSMKGAVETITNLAPVIHQSEKDIIRLQEADKYLGKQIEENKISAEFRIKSVEDNNADLVQDFKDSRKQDQYILVAIGVAAIGAQILIPLFIK